MSKWQHRSHVYGQRPRGGRAHSPADIHHEGRVAFQAELTQGDNPYPTGTTDARSWEAGFLCEFAKFYFTHPKENPA